MSEEKQQEFGMPAPIYVDLQECYDQYFPKIISNQKTEEILKALSKIIEDDPQSIQDNKDIFTQILTALDEDVITILFSKPDNSQQGIYLKVQQQLYKLIIEIYQAQNPTIAIDNSDQFYQRAKEFFFAQQQIGNDNQISNIITASQQPINNTINNMLVKPKNYRTVPCRLYHSLVGCTRGDFCHFIHESTFQGVDIPRDIMLKIRQENIIKYHSYAIPQQAHYQIPIQTPNGNSFPYQTPEILAQIQYQPEQMVLMQQKFNEQQIPIPNPIQQPQITQIPAKSDISSEEKSGIEILEQDQAKKANEKVKIEQGQSPSSLPQIAIQQPPIFPPFNQPYLVQPTPMIAHPYFNPAFTAHYYQQQQLQKQQQTQHQIMLMMAAAQTQNQTQNPFQYQQRLIKDQQTEETHRKLLQQIKEEKEKKKLKYLEKAKAKDKKKEKTESKKSNSIEKKQNHTKEDERKNDKITQDKSNDKRNKYYHKDQDQSKIRKQRDHESNKHNGYQRDKIQYKEKDRSREYRERDRDNDRKRQKSRDIEERISKRRRK